MKSKGQRFMFWSGLFGFIVIGLFPPWIGVYHSRQGYVVMSQDLGYSFIGDPPRKERNGYRDFHEVEVDGTRLLIEWVCLLALTAGIIVGLRTRHRQKSNIAGTEL